MELYSEIAGEDEWYRLEGKENILTSFYVFFENGEMYELIKEPFTETVVSDNLLVKFTKVTLIKFNIFYIDRIKRKTDLSL